jgi:hypothetical protein
MLLALTSTWAWYRLHMPMVRPPPTLPALWLVPYVSVRYVLVCVRAWVVCVFVFVSFNNFIAPYLHSFAQIIKHTVHTM